MTERESWIPYFPCMWDKDKDCINCKLLGTNMENFRKLRWNRYVRYVVSHEVADDPPSLDQLIDLLRRMDERINVIHSDALGLIEISPKLKRLGEQIVEARKEYVRKITRIEKLDLHCPAMEGRDYQLPSLDELTS